MLGDGVLSLGELEEEVRLGYFRPSLIEEVRSSVGASQPDAARVKHLEQIDAEAGFVKHKDVYDRKRARKKLIAEYMARPVIELAAPALAEPWRRDIGA